MISDLALRQRLEPSQYCLTAAELELEAENPLL